MRVSGRTASSAVALVTGTLLVWFGLALGLPVMSYCLGPERPLFKSGSSSEALLVPANCFALSESPYAYNWKLALLVTAALAIALGATSVFAAWALVKRRDYARACWLVTSLSCATYCLAFKPLSHLDMTPNITAASLFVGSAIVAYFMR